MNRVVITGMGCVSAIGSTVESFRTNLFAGTHGMRPVDGLVAAALAAATPGVAPIALRFTLAAQVAGFDPAAQLAPSLLQISERSGQMALVAAAQAVEQAGLFGDADTELKDRTAIVLGCSAGGRSAEEPETAKLYGRGARVHPLTVPKVMTSAGASLVSMAHGVTGPVYTVSTACASAAHAIGQAFHMVRSGMVTAAITGGHEAPLTYGFLKAWDSLHVVSPTQCRPFSADRDGMTLGEGAAIFVLESLEHALARGATIYGEICGFGMSSDAHHITQPHASGPAAAMMRCLADACATADEVGYINAHGTGTAANDRVEAEAICRVFGGTPPPVSSTKAQHGHAIGASGALEALATVLALRDGVLPATAGVEAADAELGLDVIVGAPREERPQLALSNSFAFGGLNAVLAFRPYLRDRQ